MEKITETIPQLECDDCHVSVLHYEIHADPERTGKYCIDCFRLKFFMCDDCYDIKEIAEKCILDRGTVCLSCRERYNICEDCGIEVRDSEICPCQDEDEENSEIAYREYDRSDKYTIQNHRAYSCEIECYYPDRSTMNKVAKKLPQEIGITSDGSLHSNGIEFNTPKLSGGRGEKLLKEFTSTLLENDFKVDAACGLHIHLDGKDILSTTNAIQKLMIFFMVYEDVIMSFLPLSRRDNHYCLPISEFYHLNEIKNCYEIEGFEKIWYRDDSKENREIYKQDRHHQSRYAGINFHSLVAQGHLEIRYHSGTINYEKIINWIKLFSTILDKVVYSSKHNTAYKGSLQLPSLLKTRFILGLTEKTTSFFDVLDLSDDQRAYFIKRQAQFSGNAEEKN